MGYQEALEAAGAKVLAFEMFGSYQGDWLAKLEYEDSQFWIKDYFGSCSGCDAFEAEIGWNPTPDQLAEFGRKYLDPSERLTQAEIEAKISKNIKWDMDAKRMLDFVKEHAL